MTVDTRPGLVNLRDFEVAARTCLEDLRPEAVIAAATELLDGGRFMSAPLGRSPNGI